MEIEEIGKRLKWLREEKRIKITDFANKLGYTGLASYSNIEKGKAKTISIDLIFRAAEILDVSVKEILGLTSKTENLDSLNKEIDVLRDEKEKAELSLKYLKVKIQKDYLEVRQDSTIISQFLLAYIQVKELQSDLSFRQVKEAIDRIQSKLDVLQELLISIGEENRRVTFSNSNHYEQLMSSKYQTTKEFAKELMGYPPALIGEIPEDILNDEDAVINFLIEKMEKGKAIVKKYCKY